MLKDPAYGWEIPVNLRLTLPDGSKQEHKENLMEKPRGRWIEIPAGEIKSSTEKTGEMEFSLYEYEGGKWKKGLLIKGVKIQPKAWVQKYQVSMNMEPSLPLNKDLCVSAFVGVMNE